MIDLSSIEGLAGSAAGELLAAFEGVDEDDDEGPDMLRVRLTASEARGFVNRAAGGRRRGPAARARCAASRSIRRATSARVATATTSTDGEPRPDRR